MTMATISSPRFDVVEYIKKLRNAGASQELAEIQAQEMEHIIEDVLQQTKQASRELFDSKELATKMDVKELEVKLEVKIAQIEANLLKWMLGVGISATIVILSGVFTMLKFMLHQS